MAQFYLPKSHQHAQRMIKITATDLDPFGQGVARYQGKTLFVAGLLPNKQAEVIITEEKNNSPGAKLSSYFPTVKSARCQSVYILGFVVVVNNNM